MSNQDLNLKLMPMVASKDKIKQIYSKLPRRTVASIIKLAIKTVNENSLIKISSKTHMLNRRHIMIIVEELGLPDGYVLPNTNQHNGQ